LDVARQNKERAFWDKFARKYDRFMNRTTTVYEPFIQKIEPYLYAATVLEVATGTGNIAFAVAPKSKTVYACDLSEEMIKVANEKLACSTISNIDFQVQDAYALDYPSDSMDVVVISNALHVMVHPEKALTSVKRVLKKDGLLVISLFCHGQSIRSRTLSFFMSLTGFKAYHKWSLGSFNSFLESNNYVIVQSEFVSARVQIPIAFVVAKKQRKKEVTPLKGLCS
jgi:ubiquinone/menaquinone biosynthesis C-methylase UbiE